MSKYFIDRITHHTEVMAATAPWIDGIIVAFMDFILQSGFQGRIADQFCPITRLSVIRKYRRSPFPSTCPTWRLRSCELLPACRPKDRAEDTRQQRKGYAVCITHAG
jgi:hypothetical protein